MNPRITANQQRTFLQLFAQVRPQLGSDSGLPRRIKDLLGRNRAFGSRDRRLYRELIYTGIRFLPWIGPLLETHPDLAAKIVAWLAPDLRDTKDYRAALCGDWPAVPATIVEKSATLTAFATGRASSPNEPSSASAHRDDSPYLFDTEALLPSWFREHCPAAFIPPHLDSINERASLWVRLQVNDADHVLAEFSGKGWSPARATEPADAVCLPPNAEVADTDAYRRGFVEIQDLGSQLVLHHAAVAPGQIWLDACAGAGGKTLQLARLVGDNGRVDATDIRLATLEELRDRADRARLTNVRILNAAKGGTRPLDEFKKIAPQETRPETGFHPVVPPQNSAASYDGVLVDAPCSGTGTWRRLPHMKWYTQPAMLAEFAALQLQILTANAPRVRPGGLLVYATCSLSGLENHDTVAAFLETHPNFKVEPPVRDWGAVSDGLGHTLLPGTRNSDGFYVALLRRSPG